MGGVESAVQRVECEDSDRRNRVPSKDVEQRARDRLGDQRDQSPAGEVGGVEKVFDGGERRGALLRQASHPGGGEDEDEAHQLFGGSLKTLSAHQLWMNLLI